MRLRIRHAAAYIGFTALLLLLVFPASSSEEAMVEPVAGILETFYQPVATDCYLKYDAPFYYTILALRTQTYQQMFDSKTPAYKIVMEWEKNLKIVDPNEYPDVKPINTALKALAHGINKGKAAELSFRAIVEYRLNKFPADLDAVNDLIQNLLDAEFRFPLFDLASGASSERKLKLLDIFLESYKGPNSGGMGNVPMQAFYTSRVDPWVYSNAFIDRVILPMQGQVTPIYKKVLDCNDAEILSGDAGWCCCNDNTHGNDYRKCYEIGDQSYNCRERDGFCSIGTLKTCPGHIH